MPSSIFSFFSGVGFLDLGFETEGFEVAFANEFNPQFAQSYRYSRERMQLPLPSYGVDVASIEGWLEPSKVRELRRMMAAERKKGQSVGFIGGPPCPDFSVGGKNRGQHGENGRLTRTYFELISAAKPDWFLFENVKGLWRTRRHRAFFDEMVSLAQTSGYTVATRLINSIEYGAPQDRDRIIVVGISSTIAKKLGYPVKKHVAEEYFPWSVGRTHDAAILRDTRWPSTSPFGKEASHTRGLPRELTVSHWFLKNDVANHPNAMHAFTPRAGLVRFQQIEEGDVSRKSFKRLHRFRFSPTACYGNNEVHLHPSEARRISVAEALAIQSLPKNFVIDPSLTLSSMFKTIGNGVPFVVARGLAQMVATLLQQYNDDTPPK